MNNYTYTTNLILAYLRFCNVVYLLFLQLIGFILLIIAALLNDVSLTIMSLVIFVLFPLNLLGCLPSFIGRNHTKDLIINNNFISITKRKGKIFNSNIDNITTNKVIARFNWEGILLKDENSKTVIWKHEFSKNNWKIVAEYIYSKCPPQNTVGSYFTDNEYWQY